MVDNAIKAVVAPGGLLEQCIREEVTLAVINTVDQVVAREIHPCIHNTLDEVFTSYQDCVLTERHLAEKDLATSFQVQRESAKTDFQEFLRDSTSASINALDAALHSTEWKIDCKRNSVVEAITTACQTSNPPTPTLLTPLLTSWDFGGKRHSSRRIQGHMGEPSELAPTHSHYGRPGPHVPPSGIYPSFSPLRIPGCGCHS
jgi:hypothetical protein